MVLIKENITEAITMLENLLTNCVEKETVVRIHGNVYGYTVRYSSILDEFNIDYDELCIVCGWFELIVPEKIIEFSYDETDNSVHIIFTNGELYLDFETEYNLEY